MVAVNSTMVPLGTGAPDFDLVTSGGLRHRPADLVGRTGLIVAFLSNHCPYVHHIGAALGDAARDLATAGIATVGINANDVDAYPDDAPDLMDATAARFGWDFPYLFDPTQQVAVAYRAACTPDLYLFDADLRLVYRGRFDATRPGGGATPDGADLRAAAAALAEGSAPIDDQWPSVGCNIKWRPGNAPPWFG
jgi:peroxiredoxin